MINEAKFWVNDLQSNIDFIECCKNQCDLHADELAELEKRIMVSCYIVRKLVESNKIKKDDFDSEISLNFYPKSDQEDCSLPAHEIYSNYRRYPEIVEKRFSFVSNQIIHSYYFEIMMDGSGEISSFCFNSDRSRSKGLYLVSLEDFLETLTSIAQIYVDMKAYTRNEDGVWVPKWG